MPVGRKFVCTVAFDTCGELRPEGNARKLLDAEAVFPEQLRHQENKRKYIYSMALNAACVCVQAHAQIRVCGYFCRMYVHELR